MNEDRFHDKQFVLSDFQKSVAVICPGCNRKALATVDYDVGIAHLICSYCGYNKQTSTEIIVFGMKARKTAHAAAYFNATLWFAAPFKNEIFFAYNDAHLDYLEQYIGAKLREHKDRSHFTLLEKLPKFYHEAKNRNALLKVIQKLRAKVL